MKKLTIAGVMIGLYSGLAFAIYLVINIPEKTYSNKTQCYAQTIKGNPSLLHRVKCPKGEK